MVQFNSSICACFERKNYCRHESPSFISRVFGETNDGYSHSMAELKRLLHAPPIGVCSPPTTPPETETSSSTSFSNRSGAPTPKPGVQPWLISRRQIAQRPKRPELRRRRDKHAIVSNRSSQAKKEAALDEEDGELQALGTDSALARPASPAGVHDLVSQRRLDHLCATGLPIRRKRDFELLEYLCNVIWPGFEEVDADDGTVNPFPTRWVYRTATNPALLNALLMGASSHLDTRLPSRIEDHEIIQEQLHYQIMTIRSLRNDLTSFDPAKFDDLVMVIICLATSRLRHLPQPPIDANPYCPPLRSLNWIDIYGGWPFSEMHWKALKVLIEKNGGISKVTVYGLPWILS